MTLPKNLHEKKEFARIVYGYYDIRGLEWPDEMKAILFLLEELGEMAAILVNKDGENWVRNNPEDKEGWSLERFSEELGDVIMMCQVTGMALGADPMTSLLEKMERKTKEIGK